MVELPDQDVEKAAALFAVEASKSGLVPEAGEAGRWGQAATKPDQVCWRGQRCSWSWMQPARGSHSRSETLTVAATSSGARNRHGGCLRQVRSLARHLAVPVGLDATLPLVHALHDKAANAVLHASLHSGGTLSYIHRNTWLPCAGRCSAPLLLRQRHVSSPGAAAVKKMALLHVLLERVQRAWVPVEGTPAVGFAPRQNCRVAVQISAGTPRGPHSEDGFAK